VAETLTIGHDSEWHRPVSRVVKCEHCGGMRRDLGGPHAPRLVAGVRVDCSGRRIALEAA
jgi:hypothetical protein